MSSDPQKPHISGGFTYKPEFSSRLLNDLRETALHKPELAGIIRLNFRRRFTHKAEFSLAHSMSALAIYRQLTLAAIWLELK